jgi:hypothetical protein
MAQNKRKLIAPNSLVIVGIKLTNGSILEFDYSYDAKTQTSLYILPEGKLSTAYSPSILVDSAGNEWASGDVEFHSLLHSR